MFGPPSCSNASQNTLSPLVVPLSSSSPVFRAMGVASVGGVDASVPVGDWEVSSISTVFCVELDAGAPPAEADFGATLDLSWFASSSLVSVDGG